MSRPPLFAKITSEEGYLFWKKKKEYILVNIVANYNFRIVFKDDNMKYGDYWHKPIILGIDSISKEEFLAKFVGPFTVQFVEAAMIKVLEIFNEIDEKD